MYAAATLFLDVCVQPDLWPSGCWPLLTVDQAANVVRVFSLATAFAVRQGGVVCRHDASGSDLAPGIPLHGHGARAATERPPGCTPILPLKLATDGFDHGTATYLETGCQRSPADTLRGRDGFRHMTAGVRDVVVFGAGLEYGVDRVVAALLQDRIRTHVVFDAVGTADQVLAQTVAADWKRRGVDGLTVATLARLLEGPGTSRR